MVQTQSAACSANTMTCTAHDPLQLPYSFRCCNNAAPTPLYANVATHSVHDLLDLQLQPQAKPAV